MLLLTSWSLFFLNVFITFSRQIALIVNIKSTIQIHSFCVFSNSLLSLVSQPSGKKSPCLPSLFPHFSIITFYLSLKITVMMVTLYWDYTENTLLSLSYYAYIVDLSLFKYSLTWLPCP